MGRESIVERPQCSAPVGGRETHCAFLLISEHLPKKHHICAASAPLDNRCNLSHAS